MTGKKFEILAVDYLRGTLSAKEKKNFEELLNSDSNYQELFAELQEAWEMMDFHRVPEPSQQMDEHFFEVLQLAIEKQNGTNSSVKVFWDNLMVWLAKPQFAYALLILVLLGGFFFNRDGSTDSNTTQTVIDSDVQEVRERLILTLLEQGSANKRLQGVSEANKITEVDKKVIDALLRTLNNDSNVNVRLAAIESLSNYVDDPVVRQGLIQSIPNQESPIVQVTLANLMLALEEEQSIEPFKRLLEKNELDTTVKKRIEKTIESII